LLSATPAGNIHFAVNHTFQQVNPSVSGLSAHAITTVHLHKRAGWYAFVRALKPRVVAEAGEILYGGSFELLLKTGRQIDLFIKANDHFAANGYKEYLCILPKLANHSIILGNNSKITDGLLRFSVKQNRKYLFFKEEPLNHWYPGGGIGISFL
jgi:hypothetical protein